MAANFNEVILVGNLTRTPETKPVGTSSVCEFGMAINRKTKNKDSGEVKEEVCFVDISAWNRAGEVVQQYVDKGQSLLVCGRLKLDQWEDKEGNKRSKLSVVAERVQLMGSGKQEGGGAQGGGAAPAASQAPLPVAAAGSDTLPF
jgi:single-strand DNA-binding protein